jgi:hypothetical protein
MEKNMKKQISKNEYYQLTGLLYLAKTYNRKLVDIGEACQELTGEVDEMGHTMDAIYSDYSADDLLERLHISVQE